MKLDAWRSARTEEGSRDELGGADGVRMELMAQFQPQVPDPLSHQLPAFLFPGRMGAPSVGIDLLFFIESTGSKAPRCRYNSTTSQAVKRAAASS